MFQGYFLLVVVIVSLPSTLSVAEDDGVFQVCVTLSGLTADNIQTDFSVTVTVSDGSGIVIMFYNKAFIFLYS